MEYPSLWLVQGNSRVHLMTEYHGTMWIKMISYNCMWYAVPCRSLSASNLFCICLEMKLWQMLNNKDNIAWIYAVCTATSENFGSRHLLWACNPTSEFCESIFCVHARYSCNVNTTPPGDVVLSLFMHNVETSQITTTRWPYPLRWACNLCTESGEMDSRM